MYNGPGYQHMVSFDDKLTIQRRHEEHCTYRGATSQDIIIRDVEDLPSWDVGRRQGLKTQYTIEFFTYLGWKTYMLHTGIIASDPKHEP